MQYKFGVEAHFGQNLADIGNDLQIPGITGDVVVGRLEVEINESVVKEASDELSLALKDATSSAKAVGKQKSSTVIQLHLMKVLTCLGQAEEAAKRLKSHKTQLEEIRGREGAPEALSGLITQIEKAAESAVKQAKELKKRIPQKAKNVDMARHNTALAELNGVLGKLTPPPPKPKKKKGQKKGAAAPKTPPPEPATTPPSGSAMASFTVAPPEAPGGAKPPAPEEAPEGKAPKLPENRPKREGIFLKSMAVQAALKQDGWHADPDPTKINTNHATYKKGDHTITVTPNNIKGVPSDTTTYEAIAKMLKASGAKDITINLTTNDTKELEIYAQTLETEGVKNFEIINDPKGKNPIPPKKLAALNKKYGNEPEAGTAPKLH